MNKELLYHGTFAKLATWDGGEGQNGRDSEIGFFFFFFLIRLYYDVYTLISNPCRQRILFTTVQVDGY
jgi:hypothetical protein